MNEQCAIHFGMDGRNYTVTASQVFYPGQDEAAGFVPVIYGANRNGFYGLLMPALDEISLWDVKPEQLSVTPEAAMARWGMAQPLESVGPESRRRHFYSFLFFDLPRLKDDVVKLEIYREEDNPWTS